MEGTDKGAGLTFLLTETVDCCTVETGAVDTAVLSLLEGIDGITRGAEQSIVSIGGLLVVALPQGTVPCC